VPAGNPPRDVLGQVAVAGVDVSGLCSGGSCSARCAGYPGTRSPDPPEKAKQRGVGSSKSGSFCDRVASAKVCWRHRAQRETCIGWISTRCGGRHRTRLPGVVDESFSPARVLPDAIHHVQLASTPVVLADQLLLEALRLPSPVLPARAGQGYARAAELRCGTRAQSGIGRCSLEALSGLWEQLALRLGIGQGTGPRSGRSRQKTLR